MLQLWEGPEGVKPKDRLEVKLQCLVWGHVRLFSVNGTKSILDMSRSMSTQTQILTDFHGD